jgi:putative oxidoreductase
MSAFAARWAALAPWLLGLMRIATALLFIEHGTQKYFGFPSVAEWGIVQPLSLFGIAGILELAGGTLLLLGLFTRPVAFVLSGMMAVAYFLFHLPHGFYPIDNGGDAAILFCFAFLYFSAAGPGAPSLDARRSRMSR